MLEVARVLNALRVVNGAAWVKGLKRYGSNQTLDYVAKILS